MAKNSIEQRFRRRLEKERLQEISRRRRSKEEIEQEKEILEKAKAERSKNPEKFRIIAEKKPGRNDPCPCGSGKKYKHCCGANK